MFVMNYSAGDGGGSPGGGGVGVVLACSGQTIGRTTNERKLTPNGTKKSIRKIGQLSSQVWGFRQFSCYVGFWFCFRLRLLRN